MSICVRVKGFWIKDLTDVLILCVCLILLHTSKTYAVSDPNSPDSLAFKQAEDLFTSGEYENARQAFQNLLETRSDSKHTRSSLMYLSMCGINLDDQNVAETNLNLLLRDYASSEGMDDVIHQIADQYYRKFDHTKAAELSDYILENLNPTPHVAVWSNVQLAFKYIEESNPEGIQRILNRFIIDFANYESAHDPVYTVADYLYRNQFYTQAVYLFDHLLSKWPDYSHNIDVLHKRVLAQLELNDLNAANNTVTQLLANYTSQELSPERLHQIAYRYRQLGRVAKAGELSSYILQNYETDDHIKAWSLVDVALKAIDNNQLTLVDSYVQDLEANHATFSQLASCLYTIADYLHRNGNHDRSAVLMKYLIDNLPNSDHAFNSQKTLLLSYLNTGNREEAMTTAEQLVLQYANHEKAAEVFHQTAASAYFNTETFDVAATLSEAVVEAGLADDHTLVWSYVYLARQEIESGNDAGALSLCHTLLTDYANYWHMPYPVYFIAEIYAERGEPAQMAPLLQLIADYTPPALQNQVAKNTVAILEDIRQHNNSAFQTKRDDLLARYAEQSSLDKAIGHSLLLIAEAFHKEGFRLQNAGNSVLSGQAFNLVVETAKQMVQRYATQQTTPTTPDIYCYAGDAYFALGRYTECIDYFESVRDSYPDFRHRWHALHRIGQCYEQLAKAAVISAPEAEITIRSTYEQIVRDYPDSDAATHAQIWLTENVAN